MNSHEFDNAGESYGPDRQAANEAMARYFVFYLQARGRLLPVYEAFRDRFFDALAEDPGEEAVRLIEDAMGGDSIEAIDESFQAWFKPRPL